MVNITQCIDAMKTLKAIKGESDNVILATEYLEGAASRCTVSHQGWLQFISLPPKRASCKNKLNCICLIPECSKCPQNTFSEGGQDVKCKSCLIPKLLNKDWSKCLNPFDLIDEVKKDLEKEKENKRFIHEKLTSMAKEQIRLEHDKIMVNRRRKDNNNEKKQCENELKGVQSFPSHRNIK